VDRRTAATGTFQRTEATSVPLEGAQRLSGRCILDELHKEFLFCINYSLVLLHNGGFCNGCITKRILLFPAFHSQENQYYADYDKKYLIFYEFNLLS
jgi:hypothetical protein